MVKIISDSTCDFSPECAARFDIDILPLHVLMGDEDRLDDVHLTHEMLFSWADANHTTPKTSAPSVDEAMQMFDQYLQQGMEIVAFSISEKMSASYNNMCRAAQVLGAEDKISVVDSMNLSAGVGHLAIEASLMAKAGKGREEIAREMEQLKHRLRSSFVVDTLEYLHRGGRCSGLAAMMGSVLKLHPRIIVVEDGTMVPGKKYRGSIMKATMDFAKDLEAELRASLPARVMIAHTAQDEVLQAVCDYLKSLDYFGEIIVNITGSVVASHCGPGTLGIFYIAQQAHDER